MHEGRDGRDAIHELETDGHVDEHQYAGDGDGDKRVAPQFIARHGAYARHRYRRQIGIPRLQVRFDIVPDLLRLSVQDVLILVSKDKLGLLGNRRNDLIAGRNIFGGNCSSEFKVRVGNVQFQIFGQYGSAGKIDSEDKAFHKEHYNANRDDEQRSGKKVFGRAHQAELLFHITSPPPPVCAICRNTAMA